MLARSRKRRNRGVSALWLLCTCLGSLCTVACGPSASSPASFEARLDEFAQRARTHSEHIALLAGVSDYAESGLPDLPGSRNDVALMQQLLVERLGYAEDDILVLLDDEATHANIVRAFDRALLQPAQAHTEAFLFLAGHGSRIRDESDTRLAEPDATDSTFVAYDSRMHGKHGEHDLSDDELRSLLEALTQKTDRVTVITDSCHSGGMVRGAQRNLVPDALVALDLNWVKTFWPAAARLTEDAPGERLDPSRFVHIAASRRDQSAREITVSTAGEERSFGALTYLLVKTLENAPADTAWSQIVDTVAARVRREAHQSITAEGNLERRVFAPGCVSVRGYRARATVNQEQIEVQAGFLLGLRQGSILAVRDARGETLLGQARVEQVSPDTAVARWLEPPKDPSQLALRVQETQRGLAEPALRILRTGAKAFGALPLVQLVAADERAAYRIEGKGEDARLETIDGIDIGMVDVSTLEGEVTFESLLGLANEHGSLQLRIALRRPSEAELTSLKTQAEAIPILTNDANSSVVAGAPQGASTKRVAMFDLTNDSSQALFVYLLSLEESRERHLISLPNQQGDACVMLEAGATQSVPASIVARNSWSPARPMLDRYLALAFPAKLHDPYSLEGSAHASSRGITDELPGILQRVIHADHLRGAGPVPIAPEGWGVAHFDLLVVPRP